MTFTKSSATVNGRTLRYLEATPGAAPRGTLVLLHAFPLSARMWEPQLPLVASGWRLVAPQFRQFDDGAGDVAASSMDDYADDVVALLDALDIGGATVCGLSMGGYVAFAMWRRAPEMIRGLVLADTRPQADTPEGVDGRKKMLALLADRGPTTVADEMLPKLLGDTTRAGRPEIVKPVRGLIVENSSDAIAGALRALMSRPDSTPLLASIDVPTLVIVGAEDKVTPPQVAEELHAAIAGSRLTVIAAAGHLSNVERPDAFNRAVGRFLETGSPG